MKYDQHKNLFEEISKDAENFYRDNAGFKMNYDDFMDYCCNAWEEHL